MAQTKHGQVHRFHDYVAAYLGTGETIYLEPKDARKFARALNAVAKSCLTEDFLKSTCGTKWFVFNPTPQDRR